MKRALWYSIRKRYGVFEVVAVVSFKQTHWYGRVADNQAPTSGLMKDLIGRFSSWEAAYEKLSQVRKIFYEYHPWIAGLDFKKAKLVQEREKKIAAVLAAPSPEPATSTLEPSNFANNSTS